MNSSQRRKLKRACQYAIKLVPEKNWEYSEHYINVQGARAWCNKNVKCYTVTYYWDVAEFKFTREKDAVFFALKWQ